MPAWSRPVSSPKTALIVGATGVAGRALARHLAGSGDWNVIGVARRPLSSTDRIRYVQADLSDSDATSAALSSLKSISHIFYCAYTPAPTWAQQCEPNAALLRNVVDAVEPVAPGLRHICLLQGTKYYGAHLGPFQTPAHEDDPRHFPPNFYYNQQDFLARRQAGKQWTYSCARPHTICGYAVGTSLNLLSVIGVYATISRELGLPLRWPGRPGAFRTIYQVTDGDLLARAMAWMATEPACANQAFNITNGDFFRFEQVWPLIARHFQMESGAPQQIDLEQFMEDKEPLWNEIVARYELAPTAFRDAANWSYANYAFSCDWDIMSSTIKARQHGFHDCMDSRDMLIQHLVRLGVERLIPQPCT